MMNNNYGWELLCQQERACAEAHAEDMDNWSALREEEDTWVADEQGGWVMKLLAASRDGTVAL